MRACSLIVLAGIFLLGACDSAQDITGPEVPVVVEPLFHFIPPGAVPDGSFSMYYFDLDLRNNLILKVGQSSAWSGEDELAFAKCPGTSGGHTSDDYTGGPPDLDQWPAATGIGSFMIRQGWWRTRGLLVVKGACWFDEWNGKGFPESAWVHGNAWQGFKRMPFWVKLESRGFPELEHVLEGQLDLGELYFEKWGSPTRKLRVEGELHHENGLTLIG